ncbi:MAG: rod shape-determining protein RodA [Gemmatimonadetes bacterium]|nr:rod shape-determining protein RodA [Gemmatimonadota bacterium]MCC6772827.1 rod shape-determining protein RodA [Gemmatimonadaceae bacterium]
MIKRVFADYPLVIIALLLSAYGIAVVYSAGQTDVLQASVASAYRRQLAWFAVALVAAWLLSRASVRLIEWVSWPGYLLAIVLLLVTLFFGSGGGTASSMRGWLTVGGVRLGQPAELAKVAVVLMLAKVLAARRDPPKSLVELWLPALVVLVPWLLVMAQPDLGTGMVFVGIFFAMLFWAGVSARLLLLAASPAISLLLAFNTGLWGAWFLILIAVVLWYKPYVVEGVVLIVTNVAMGVLAPILWDKLAPHQRARLLVFLDPSEDPQASGYHVIQSQIAIGSGGWFGKGFTLGTQKRGSFLPEQHTDFIFAVVGEELGFLGVSMALALFLLLFLRVIRVASRANDSFSSLVAFGLLGSWMVHVIENVGMTLNLMPITGIPLPFFSYGGSFMLACWLAIGILVRISSEGRGEADALPIGLRGSSSRY